MIEVKPGLRCRFWNEEDGELIEREGIINGVPYVMFNATDHAPQHRVHARIPVHLPDINENYDVAGFNVTSVYDGR